MLLTTAIDYTNGKPHIGHAYEKILTDVLARYQRLRGNPVFFLTGVDQHGQKVEQTAAKEGETPAAYVERITAGFLALWEKTGVHYDGWAATTDPRHKRCVQDILTSLKEKGELYKKAYSGFYSVRQEQFLTDRDRDEQGKFGPEWGEVVEIQEENWYFRLSAHTSWLQEFLEKNDAILPTFRKAELTNAIARNTALDLCISRPKARMSWGIEIPFDPDYVTYVWFDALINYISFVGYGGKESTFPDFAATWKNVVHVIGKDIMVPAHGIYWYCMLHAMGFTDAQMPRLLVHGWWNIRGEKMSKSLGNIVDPNELADRFGTDALRYYLCRDIVIGRDSDFDVERLVMLFNTELANELGNLCNRALNMSQRFTAGVLHCYQPLQEEDLALQQSLTDSHKNYRDAMDNFEVGKALEALNRHVVNCNIYAERMKPWEMNKNPDNKERVATVLYHLAESVAHCAVMLSPILPDAAAKLAAQIDLAGLLENKLPDLAWGMVPNGHTIQKPSPVFPRIVIEA